MIIRSFYLILIIFIINILPVSAKDFWSPVSPIYGGNTTSLVSSSKGDIYASTNAGLFISSDHKEWNKIKAFKEIPLKVKIDNKDNL